MQTTDPRKFQFERESSDPERDDIQRTILVGKVAVSYTHPTLPTNYFVSISVVDVSW